MGIFINKKTENSAFNMFLRVIKSNKMMDRNNVITAMFHIETGMNILLKEVVRLDNNICRLTEFAKNRNIFTSDIEQVLSTTISAPEQLPRGDILAPTYVPTYMPKPPTGYAPYNTLREPYRNVSSSATGIPGRDFAEIERQNMELIGSIMAPMSAPMSAPSPITSTTPTIGTGGMGSMLQPSGLYGPSYLGHNPRRAAIASRFSITEKQVEQLDLTNRNTESGSLPEVNERLRNVFNSVGITDNNVIRSLLAAYPVYFTDLADGRKILPGQSLIGEITSTKNL